MRGVIRGAELEQLIAAADAVQRQGVAGEGEGHLYAPAGGGKVYWRTNGMWPRGDIFQAVSLNPELLENVGQIIGDPFYPIGHDLVVKQGGIGAPVAWHQDPPYGSPKAHPDRPGQTVRLRPSSHRRVLRHDSLSSTAAG